MCLRLNVRGGVTNQKTPPPPKIFNHIKSKCVRFDFATQFSCNSKQTAKGRNTVEDRSADICPFLGTSKQQVAGRDVTFPDIA